MPKQIINGVEFNSKKELLAYTREFIKQLGTCELSYNTTGYRFLFHLLKRHPDIEKFTALGIQKFKILPNAMFHHTYETRIIDNNYREHAFSWNNCVKGTTSTPRATLIKVLRIAVQDQTRKFKENNYEGVCKICLNHIDYFDSHIDHIYPFTRLVDDFIKLNPKVPTKFDSERETNRPIFKPVDYEWAGKWINFHLSTAKLQITCPSCNHKKGSKIKA